MATYIVGTARWMPLPTQFVDPAYWPAVYGAFVVLWVCAMKLSAMDTETLERLLAHAVVDALHMAQISRKEAAALMRMDVGQLNRQLRAEPMQHISLTRLMRLCGTSFWLFFGPCLLLIVARERYVEFAETLMFIGRRRYNAPVHGDEMRLPEEQLQRRA